MLTEHERNRKRQIPDRNTAAALGLRFLLQLPSVPPIFKQCLLDLPQNWILNLVKSFRFLKTRPTQQIKLHLDSHSRIVLDCKYRLDYFTLGLVSNGL